MHLFQDGVPRLELRARVRRISPAAGGLDLVAGVRVEPPGEADLERWRIVAQEIMNPAARSRGTSADDSWRLFQESGYFALSGCSCITDLERACPGISRDMVRRVLRDMKKADQVECLGRGPGARWRKKG